MLEERLTAAEAISKLMQKDQQSHPEWQLTPDARVTLTEFVQGQEKRERA